MKLSQKTTEFFVDVEKAFNIGGCIPIVCLFSGSFRAAAGKAQAIAGVVLAIGGGIGYLAFKDSTKKQEWKDTRDLGAEFVIHGALNVIRGFGEVILCMATFFGNLFLYFPNKSNRFKPYFEYGIFTNSKSAAVAKAVPS